MQTDWNSPRWGWYQIGGSLIGWLIIFGGAAAMLAIFGDA